MQAVFGKYRGHSIASWEEKQPLNYALEAFTVQIGLPVTENTVFKIARLKSLLPNFICLRPLLRVIPFLVSGNIRSIGSHALRLFPNLRIRFNTY